jgi:hypothetical protein
VCMVNARHRPETRSVLSRGLRRIPTLDLDQDDLKGVAALQSFAWRGVILADGYQVYNTTRFAASPVKLRRCQWGKGTRATA